LTSFLEFLHLKEDRSDQTDEGKSRKKRVEVEAKMTIVGFVQKPCDVISM
jgi:hypothetical protein